LASELQNPGIAVIGHGYWGKNHVRNFHALGALKVVCDKSAERRAAVQDEYPGVDVATQLSTILERHDVQGVILATPAETHFALAMDCLEAGVDVLVEKPLALHVREGAQLVDIAAANNRILMVGHILEYHPGIITLKELVRSGRLGKIQYLYSNRLNLGRVRREENILWSFAPHDVAIILRLLGEMPESVSATGGSYLQPDIADVTVSTFAFPGGVRAHIHVSWLHPFKEQKLVVVGDQAMAVFDDQTKELSLYKHAIDWVDRVPIPRRADPELIPYSQDEPLRAECQDFLDAIRTRKAPIADGESGLRVLEVLSRCQQSLEQGGRVLPMDSKNDGYFAHATATIDSGANIGKGTKIWHYSHVMGSSRIGESCILGQNVFVGPHCEVGNRVKIQNNVSIYQGVTLDDEVFCGPSTVFTNVKNPRAHVERKHAFDKTHVGRGATLGANCTVICGNNIGAYAMIAAGAVVTREVPAHALVAGVPAKLMGWVCSCGERVGQGVSPPADGTACVHCGHILKLK
jgi:UDP-2-acetamido-3-amino-2,3-dideoxy-glucuronate N-acetyltransferase